MEIYMKPRFWLVWEKEKPTHLWNSTGHAPDEHNRNRRKSVWLLIYSFVFIHDKSSSDRQVCLRKNISWRTGICEVTVATRLGQNSLLHQKRLEEINKRIRKNEGEKKGDTVVSIKTKNRKFVQFCYSVQSVNFWLHHNYIWNAVTLLKFVFGK